jgi:hypothetical protein
VKEEEKREGETIKNRRRKVKNCKIRLKKDRNRRKEAAEGYKVEGRRN